MNVTYASLVFPLAFSLQKYLRNIFDVLLLNMEASTPYTKHRPLRFVSFRYYFIFYLLEGSFVPTTVAINDFFSFLIGISLFVFFFFVVFFIFLKDINPKN